MRRFILGTASLVLTLTFITSGCKFSNKNEEEDTTPTYTLAYDGNGSTSGTVPTAVKTLARGEKHTVLGNTGGLKKAGCTFSDWNTAANGSGTTYRAGGTFTMGAANVFAVGGQQNPSVFSYGDGVTLTGAYTSGTAATVLKYVQWERTASTRRSGAVSFPPTPNTSSPRPSRRSNRRERL